MTDTDGRNGENRLAGSVGTEEPFVLDRAENPHPRMLGEALLARACQYDSPQAAAFWHGYMGAMAAATGLDRSEIEAWMDRHDGVAVEIR